MPADLAFVRQQYTSKMQDACRLVSQLGLTLTDLGNLYAGAGLSGTFSDAELSLNNVTKHLVAADIGTYTANLETVHTAMSSAILQNMAKAVGTTSG